MKTQFLRQLHSIHSAVKRIALQPVIQASARPRIGETTTTSATTSINDDGINDVSTLFGVRPPPVKLYKNPRTLFNLYEFGISGTKPVKELARAELDENKSLYCQQKNVGNLWYK